MLILFLLVDIKTSEQKHNFWEMCYKIYNLTPVILNRNSLIKDIIAYLFFDKHYNFTTVFDSIDRSVLQHPFLICSHCHYPSKESRGPVASDKCRVQNGLAGNQVFLFYRLLLYFSELSFLVTVHSKNTQKMNVEVKWSVEKLNNELGTLQTRTLVCYAKERKSIKINVCIFYLIRLIIHTLYQIRESEGER